MSAAASRARRALTVLLAATALLGAACSGDDGATTSTATTPDTGAQGEDEHGGGHSMGVDVGTVEEVAALGDGPGAGQEWEVPVGLAVCGRYVDVPGGEPVGGVQASGSGTATVRAEADGEPPTVGDYARAVGVGLRTGELSLPGAVAPGRIELGDEELELAGATLRTGDECGQDRGEVQVWVYSAEAVRTGEGVLTIVTDPERVPFAEEGMALVIAFAPESSLPTLPPSALDLPSG